VPIPDDDDQFKQYLKQFHPLTPEPLPTVERSRTTPQRLEFAVWVAAAALVVATAFLLLYPRPKTDHSPSRTENVAQIEPSPKTQQLTIRSANALLATAPSFKTAVDDVAAEALRSPRIPLPDGKQSALAVLSKEKKL